MVLRLTLTHFLSASLNASPTAVMHARGRQIWASVGEDRSLRVGEIDEAPQQIEGTTGRMEVVALSADGTLVAGGDEQGTLAVWERRSGQFLQQVQQERIYEGMRIKGIQGITPADRNALVALGATEH